MTFVVKAVRREPHRKPGLKGSDFTSCLRLKKKKKKPVQNGKGKKKMFLFNKSLLLNVRSGEEIVHNNTDVLISLTCSEYFRNRRAHADCCGKQKTSREPQLLHYSVRFLFLADRN